MFSLLLHRVAVERRGSARPGWFHRPRRWLWALAALWPATSHAQFASVVSVVSDLPHERIWQQELQQWTRVVTLLKKEVQQTGYTAQWTGDPKKHAAGIVGSVASVLDPTQCALALATREKAQQAGRSRFSVAQTGRTALQAQHRVEPSFTLLHHTQKRDEARYTAFAEQAALLARHDEALRQLREVEQKELQLQKRLLERLRTAGTHAEIATIQASLLASQQRCDLATRKAEQARDESARYEAQGRLELERKREADREWTEALVEKLKQRALTSLHAQHGENS